MDTQTEQVAGIVDMDDSGFLEPDTIEEDRLEQEKSICDDPELISNLQSDDASKISLDCDNNVVFDCIDSVENIGGASQPTACERCLKNRDKYKKVKRELEELKAVIREYERRDKKFAVPLDCSVCSI